MDSFLKYLITTDDGQELMIKAVQCGDENKKIRMFLDYIELKKLGGDMIDAFKAEHENLMYKLDGDTKKWYKDGKLHRENDLPAMMFANGTNMWFRDGQLHRETKDVMGLVLPAVEYANGQKLWYRNGKPHRDDKDDKGRVLPAMMRGTRSDWYKDGLLHRDDRDDNGKFLPAVELTGNPCRKWLQNGKYFRDDVDENGLSLPQFIAGCGDKIWFNSLGKFHRIEKNKEGYLMPACIYGVGICEWWVNGIMIFMAPTMMNVILPEMVENVSKGIHIELEDGSEISIASGIKNISL